MKMALKNSQIGKTMMTNFLSREYMISQFAYFQNVLPEYYFNSRPRYQSCANGNSSYLIETETAQP